MEQSKLLKYFHTGLAAGIFALVILLMSGCGGGGSSSTGSSTYSGTITGFGSVFVNGIEFETQSSSISLDDSSATEDDLKVGMQVTVVGSVDPGGATGTATAIIFRDELEGIVINNSIVTGQKTGDINVMGQTVSVTLSTIIEGVATADLITQDMIVEVSGHSSGMGSITATRIEVKAPDLATYLASHSEGIEVKGIIVNHDENNSKFQIGGMTVDYSAAILDDMPAGSFDTLYVEVKSTSGIDSGSGELIASKVELENHGVMGHDGHDNEEMEIKGLITTAIDGNSFAVDGQVITVNEQTEYEDTAKSGLVVDVMVEVEGYYMNGEFIAEEIEVERESSNEVSDIITAVNVTTTNTGSVTLQSGATILITSATIMKDSRDDGFVPDQRFNLQSLSQGDYVEIYYYDNNGTLTANKLEREDI